jgi:hypothetical protein
MVDFNMHKFIFVTSILSGVVLSCLATCIILSLHDFFVEVMPSPQASSNTLTSSSLKYFLSLFCKINIFIYSAK